MPPKYRHFTDEEAKGIEPELMAMLDIARERSGVPFTITCGLRAPEKNQKVGGVVDSAHLDLADPDGLSPAVDLACDNSSDRFQMVKALLNAGLRRIILESACIHVDIDPAKPQDVLGVYVAHPEVKAA